nr:MAG TPA: hypothetical protein [Bacteriophage sp.]
MRCHIQQLHIYPNFHQVDVKFFVPHTLLDHLCFEIL